MAQSTVVSSETRQAVHDAATPDATPERAPRAPSMKRPENVSDLYWEIMRVAKNEDVPARIMGIIEGKFDPTPEEAAVLLEIIIGAERAAMMAIVKLRRDLAPKIEKAAASADSLSDVRMKLFRLATGR